MKIFLSAVSGQFKACRDALRSDLSAVGAEVVVQEDFQQHGASLLEKLEHYIASCDRMIALVGDAYGFEPNETARPAGQPRRSYTQWEYFFAMGERLEGSRQPPKDIFLYVGSQEFLAMHPVSQFDDAAQLQQEFIKELVRSGKDRNQFNLLHELRALVLRDGFRLQTQRVPNKEVFEDLKGFLLEKLQDFLEVKTAQKFESKQIEETMASFKQLDVYDRAAHHVPPVREIPQKTMLCEEVPEGKANELSEEPMLSRKAFTTIAEARRYGFLGDRVGRFIQKEFDPKNSYLFHSLKKTGKSSLLILLARAAQDRIVDRKPYIFLRASHYGGPYPTSRVELFHCLQDYQLRCPATPVLLIDNIDRQIGLHEALLALKKEEGGQSRTPIWATALTDSIGTLASNKLGDAFERVAEPLPGLLDTAQSAVVTEFFERIRRRHDSRIAEIFRDVVRKCPYVTIFYLSELWQKGKPFITNPMALRSELTSVRFDVGEIFQGIYGVQSNIGRSAVSIVCDEEGISRLLLDAIASRAAGIDCHAEIEKVFAANILWPGIATELSAGKPSVEVIDGIQEIALRNENFPPAQKREVRRYLIETKPSDENFGEAVLRLDQHQPPLSSRAPAQRPARSSSNFSRSRFVTLIHEPPTTGQFDSF
jgi:Domain of unknown function (DUF4062)